VAANWIGDAVMSLPALRAIRRRFPECRIAVLARPWVAELYSRERFADEVMVAPAARGLRDLSAKWGLARRLAQKEFDFGLLMPNSFESAAILTLAGIPRRIGYNRDGRGMLLTHAVTPPSGGEIPKHESYYYLELLRRAGLLDRLPDNVSIQLDGRDEARACGLRRFAALDLGPRVVGLSPGAAYGGAKRWLPERFAESARQIAVRRDAGVALFGSADERTLCSEIAAMPALHGIQVLNLAGETSLGEFIDFAAACSVFLTNDSGSMHIAASLGVPTIAIFGATDHIATGPTGPLARVIREPVECSPCLLRECPIDHRCMKAVSADRVANAALELLK
jgi:heptosyltransferase-2